MLRTLIFSVLLLSSSSAAQDSNPPAPPTDTQKDVKQRVKTARELSKQGSSGFDTLIPMLHDPAPQVRLEAVKSIVDVGTQRSIEPLIAATRDNDAEVQIRAVDGIVNFYLPGYVQTGVSKWTSAVKGRFQKENDQIVEPFVQVRADALAAIGKLATGGASMESRANAGRAIGILRGKSAVPDLVQSLQAKNDDVLFESLIALQKIKDESAGPKVVFLLRDLKERVQLAAIDTVGLLRTREAVPELRRTFDDARNDRVRRSALTALAMLPDPASRPYFQRGFTDKNDGTRAAAAEGFGRLKEPADLDFLTKAFAEESKMPPRLAEAFALVNLGKTQTDEFAPLTYLVNTLNSRLYKGIAQAYLNELARDTGVRTSLNQLLQQGTKDEKIGLARVLSVSGDKSSLQAIENLTKDPDQEVAEEALRSLRTLKARLP